MHGRLERTPAVTAQQAQRCTIDVVSGVFQAVVTDGAHQRLGPALLWGVLVHSNMNRE